MIGSSNRPFFFVDDGRELKNKALSNTSNNTPVKINNNVNNNQDRRINYNNNT